MRKKQNVLPTPMPEVDEIGMLKAQIADLQEQYARLSAAIIEAAGNYNRVNGILFGATIVPPSMQWRIDKDRLIADMGEDWVNKYMKLSPRAAYVLVNARKVAAA